MRALAPAWPPKARVSSTATESPSDAAYTAVASPAGPEPTIATSGAAWVRGSQWGSLQGTLAVAALKGSEMLFLRFDTAGSLVSVGLWSIWLYVPDKAMALLMRHVFDDLGYRRFEWKCNNENLPSKRAALRFGFRPEGVFHQHLIVKGRNRDTAWFAMLDKDWAKLRPAYEAWLAAENFDHQGAQLRKLEDLRAELGAG